MELLKEAIFDADEINLIKDFCKAVLNNSDESSNRSRAKEIVETSPLFKLLNELGDPKLLETARRASVASVEKFASETDKRILICKAIITKLALYENCKIQ